MKDETFYGENSGRNYAVARYLMQFLQEQGQLEAFYARIRDRKDPDAKSALLEVCKDLGGMERIQTAWSNWVLRLPEP